MLLDILSAGFLLIIAGAFLTMLGVLIVDEWPESGIFIAALLGISLLVFLTVWSLDRLF